MRVKLQLVLCSDDGREETVTDLVTLQKDSQRIEHLGLTLREAKQLLTTIQKRLLQHQVEAFLDACSTCPDCRTSLKVKGYRSRSFRTLFDTFKLSSPRLCHCSCWRRMTILSVVNFIMLISSGDNRETRAGRLRTHSVLRQPSLCP